MISLFVVLPASIQDVTLLTEYMNHGHDDNILRLEGLPWTATKGDIESFFKGSIDAQHFITDRTKSYRVNIAKWIVFQEQTFDLFDW